MGRYDIIMQLAEIRRLMHEKKYKKALTKVEKINIEKLKLTTDLNMLVEVYLKNEQYESARELLLKVYDKTPTRRVIYQLICVLIKSADHEHLESLYEEYIKKDKSSVDRIILKYCIDKALGKPKEQLLEYLTTLKKEDYQEEWAYELAKLYHKLGMEEACVKECEDIIIWFGEGLIVEKAKLLKLHYVEGLDILSHQKTKDKQEDIVLENELQESKPSDEELDSALEDEQKEEILVEEHKDNLEEKAEEIFISDNIEYTEDTLEQRIACIMEEIVEDKPIHFLLIEDDSIMLTEAAKEIAKELLVRDYLKTSQIAKITAEKINGIALDKSYDKLKDHCLLIEHAGDMTQDAINQLILLMEMNENNIVVILEDNEEAFSWLFKKNKILKNWFLYNIYLPTAKNNGLI